MSEYVSEQSSIIYNIRLPKDPPRSFDIDRVTPRLLFDAIQINNMSSALMPICKLVGLDDYKLMTQKVAAESDWRNYSSNRPYWLLCWLVQDNLRSGI